MKTHLAQLGVCVLALFLGTGATATELNPFKPVPEVRLNDGRVLQGFRVRAYTNDGISAAWKDGSGVVAYESFPLEWGATITRFRPKTTVSSPPDSVTLQQSTAAVVQINAPAAPPPRPPLSRPRISALHEPASRPPSFIEPSHNVLSTKLEGQVFITAESAEVFKLSLVKIRVFPTNYITEFEKWHAAEFGAAAKDLSVYLTSLEREKQKLEERYRALMSDDHQQAIEVLEAKIINSQERISVAKELMTASGLKYSWLALVPPSVSCTTDADGKFTLEVPYDNYTLVAQSRREVLKATLYYSWAIGSGDVTDKKHVYLTSENNKSTSIEHLWTPQTR